MSAAWVDLICARCEHAFTVYYRGSTNTTTPLCGSCLMPSDPAVGSRLIAENLVGQEVRKQRPEPPRERRNG